MKGWGKYAIILFLCSGLSACASAPEKEVCAPGTDLQTVFVNTPGVTGAHCFLQAGAMSYPMAAPGKVAVRRGDAVMDVTCFKGEHMVGNQRVSPVCSGCGYPENIIVAMSLDQTSMQRNVAKFIH